MTSLPEIRLLSRTPAAWAERAAAHLPELLADHAACELQAAVAALSLVGFYPQDVRLVDRLSALAVEELRHFRRAQKEGGRFGGVVSPRRRKPYAAALKAACRTAREPERGLDLLLVCALIEARSHERFAVLAPRIADGRLARFYRELAEAEARHGPAYLELAVAHAGPEATRKRLGELLRIEAEALERNARPDVSVHGAA
ncbi:MAG TPA: tRNA isopentenyl-2-thiomethyl-A-37 hydroxylase MiaE [Thermoanaerobaculia bacterium]|nr:tRNA isopentenyl-2-thiomethyl-A-37 hydroxylase MiaE [Thermoanaerobaculia bacterium]